MARKWKQINKFVEVFAHAVATSGLVQRDAAGPMRVVDFGSGKGYLTFAVHAYLREAFGRCALVTGVELRQELVALCARAVKKLGLEGLAFEQGDVRSYTPPAIDGMIALHACDTATDHAIHLGLRAGAAIIMCAPCCHKQIRPQLLSPHPLRPILQHGVHLGQQADMLTDGLRALWLEACGYDTQVFEFVSLEHTNKNKMILAVKRAHPGSPQKVLEEIRAIKDFYGIREHCLESLLRADGLLA
jgi:SAM-dependent methyltransferase